MHSEHQLSLAFNSAIDPMWLIRMEGPNSFHFETVNTAFTHVTGWTLKQVEGQPIENIMPAASHELVRSKYNEAIATGKIVDYVEEARHPSGIKYGEIRVIPILAQNGEPTRILGIANDITEKVELHKKLDKEQALRSRQITAAVIRGQESEKANVSRELHDNVIQVLTTIKLYLELSRDEKVAFTEILPKCIDYLGKTINEIRQLSKQLSAPTLGKTSFRDTLRDLAESVGASSLIRINFDFDRLPFSDMEDDLHLTVYRLAQEQLTNIVKHAKASKVDLSLSLKNGLLQFEISDNGAGFDTGQKRQGIGLINMTSRVETVGGTLRVQSAPGKGTTLVAQIPVVISGDICHADQTITTQL